MWSYVTNPVRETCGRTCNWPNIFEIAQGPEGKYNPVFELHFLAGVISQGLVGYITMGVNATPPNVQYLAVRFKFYDNFWKR